MSYFRGILVSAFIIGALFQAEIASAQTAPQLSSITLTSSTSLTAGDTVSYNFTVTVGTDPTINWVHVALSDPAGHEIDLDSSPGASGTLSMASSAYWMNGNYTVGLIEVQDSNAIRTQYYPNGTINYPFGGTGPSTNSISWASLGFSLTGGVSSVTAPQLSSITLTSSTSLTAGDTVSYNFTVTVGTDPTINWVHVALSDPAGHEIDLDSSPGASGTLSMASTTSWIDGNYTVGLIEVQDSDAYRTQYRPDGTITYPFGGSGPGTNSISFAALGFTLTGGVSTPPSITAQPANQAVTAGGSATFSVTATGSPAPTYQWNFNSSAISGATSTSYTVTDAQSSNAGSYTVTVTNTAGSVTSSAATLTVDLPPTITSQPSSETTTQGFLGQFSVTATGTAPLTYQWSLNGAPIGGATSFIYSISSASSSDAGGYTVTITNSVGSVTSNIATLTVNSSGSGTPPAITAQPANQAVTAGGSATFSVTATGSPAPTYQWNFNGTAIVGATSSSYTVTNAQSSNAGSYTVTVTNSAGSVTSSAAALTVSSAGSGTPPAITTQPSNQTVAAGSTAIFSVTATASPAPTYQWFLDGIAVPGGTSSILTVSGVTSANAGNYTCAVTNSAGTVNSSPATLTVSTANPSRLVNISARAFVGTGGNVLIAGYVIEGSGGLPVLLRASGPALISQNVTGVLPDPQLQLYSGSTVIASNAGWGGNPLIVSTANAVGAFAWTNSLSKDSALLETQNPGAYTAITSGVSGDTGVALAEVYDATPSGTTPTSRLANISARAFVGTGGNVLIAGFVIEGSTTKTVLIRASGPALIPQNVTGVLPDPQIQLYNGSTVINSNAGWGGNSAIVSAAISVGAFTWTNPSSNDSAILVTLPAGAYTAIVSGVSGDTGVALVEVYDVP